MPSSNPICPFCLEDVGDNVFVLQKSYLIEHVGCKIVIKSGSEVSSVSSCAIRDRRALFAVRMLTKFYPITILHCALSVEVMSPGSLLMLKSQFVGTANIL